MRCSAAPLGASSSLASPRLPTLPRSSSLTSPASTAVKVTHLTRHILIPLTCSRARSLASPSCRSSVKH
eukprot:3739361-Alexandrium_andersonii.AAC.1